MPVYLLHGFRWPRIAIRIHIILNNIDDAAAEWISSRTTSSALLESLRTLHPEPMSALPNLQFVEQYDPADTSPAATSQPYAFVADKVEKCELSVDVSEVMGKGVNADGWGALVELRDQLAKGEKVGWYVVYNGDEERWAPKEEEEEEEVVEEEEKEKEVVVVSLHWGLMYYVRFVWRANAWVGAKIVARHVQEPVEEEELDIKASLTVLGVAFHRVGFESVAYVSRHFSP